MLVNKKHKMLQEYYTIVESKIGKNDLTSLLILGMTRYLQISGHIIDRVLSKPLYGHSERTNSL